MWIWERGLKIKSRVESKKTFLFEKVPTGLVQRATPYLNGIILPCLTSSQHKLEWLPPSYDCNYIVSVMTFVSVVCWSTFYNLPIRSCSPSGLFCRHWSVCELLSHSKSCCVWTFVPFPCKRQIPKIHKKQITSLKNNGERVIWKKKVILKKEFLLLFRLILPYGLHYPFLFKHSLQNFYSVFDNPYILPLGMCFHWRARKSSIVP